MTDKAFQLMDYIKSTVLLNVDGVGSNVFFGDANVISVNETPALFVSYGENPTLGDQGVLVNGYIDRLLNVNIGIAILDSSQKKYELLSTINSAVYEILASSLSQMRTDLPFVIDFWFAGDMQPNIENDQAKDLFTMTSVWNVHYQHSPLSN